MLQSSKDKIAQLFINAGVYINVRHFEKFTLLLFILDNG